jgi:methyl-accepting chemotaxis protein
MTTDQHTSTLRVDADALAAPSEGNAHVSRQLQDLAHEVAACVPALPVLKKQLQQAVQTVEESVVDVCGTFMTIAKQAREAVATTPGGQQGDSVAQLLSSCSQAFDRLLEHIERSSNLVNSTTSRIADFERGMGEVSDLLSRIDDLARDVYVIALNGTIEAARAGEHGKTFAVVAQHTRQLATTARLTSEDIRGIVSRVSRQANEASQTLEQQVAEDRQCLDSSREQASAAMQQLTVAHDQLNEAVRHSQTANAELAASVSRAVTTMQFQDAVAQRIGHVAATLAEMETELSSKLNVLGDDSYESNTRWLDRMSSQYVMSAEREALRGTTAETPSSNSSSDLGDNIELF